MFMLGLDKVTVLYDSELVLTKGMYKSNTNVHQLGLKLGEMGLL